MKLSRAQRMVLPKRDFAIPERRAYPIDTVERARNALARVSAFGTAHEQRRVRMAVLRRYPELEHDGKIGGVRIVNRPKGTKIPR